MPIEICGELPNKHARGVGRCKLHPGHVGPHRSSGYEWVDLPGGCGPSLPVPLGWASTEHRARKAEADLRAIDFHLDEYGTGNGALHEHKGSVRRAAILCVQDLSLKLERERAARVTAEESLDTYRRAAETAREELYKCGQELQALRDEVKAVLADLETAAKTRKEMGASQFEIGEPDTYATWVALALAGRYRAGKR